MPGHTAPDGICERSISPTACAKKSSTALCPARPDLLVRMDLQLSAIDCKFATVREVSCPRTEGGSSSPHSASRRDTPVMIDIPPTPRRRGVDGPPRGPSGCCPGVRGALLALFSLHTAFSYEGPVGPAPSSIRLSLCSPSDSLLSRRQLLEKESLWGCPSGARCAQPDWSSDYLQ